MEAKRIIAGGILSAGFIIGGLVATSEGFFEEGTIGHIEACQDIQNSVKPECSDVQASAPDSLSAQKLLAQFEGIEGIAMAAVGMVGAIATSAKVFNIDVI